MKIDHLDLQVTTHRLRLFHPINGVFNFEFDYEQVQGVHVERRGFISKTTYKLTLTYRNQKYGVKHMDRGDFNDAVVAFEAAYANKARWSNRKVA